MSSTRLSPPKSVNAMTLSSPSPWNIPHQDSAVRAFNKLTRTFAAQISALKEYRSKGEQKMTVQHVHVAESGQAIVGNVNAAPEGVGARKKVEERLCNRRCDVLRHRSGPGYSGEDRRAMVLLARGRPLAGLLKVTVWRS